MDTVLAAREMLVSSSPHCDMLLSAAPPAAATSSSSPPPSPPSPPPPPPPPLSLHFVSEEKQQLSLSGSGSSSSALFTSRTRYARLTRRLQQLDGEIKAHTPVERENDRMRSLQQHYNHSHSHTATATNAASHQQQQLGLDSSSPDSSLDASTLDGLFSAVLAPSSHSSHTVGSSSHYTGEALLHAMSRLTQKDSKDDKQDAAAAAKRQQQQQQAQQQQAGAGHTGGLSSLGRATGTQQHLPVLSATVTLPPLAAPSGASAAGNAAVLSRSVPTAASLSASSADSELWGVGQSAQLSVRAVLDYYRSHPAARSELQMRIEAARAAKAAAASSAVDANKRSVGQRQWRAQHNQRSREAEARRQQAARERVQQAAAQAAEVAQRQQLGATAKRDRSTQPYFGSGRSVPPEGGGCSSDGGSDGASLGGSGGGRALLGAASSDWLDESGDSASVDRRARSLWLSIALPTAVGCTVWLERAKSVVIPRLAGDLESDVDVSLSGLFHSALVARLQDSKDAALTVLKRSLASYGQRWQDKRRRKAATLILRFLTLVHTASAIRQALRDTSVLTHILRIQRWWRRHSAVLQSQCVVVSKKWRRREAAIARQQLHSSSHSQGPTTPSGSVGVAGGGGGGIGGGQSDHHRDTTSRDRRRQPSFDARAGRYRTNNEQQQLQLHQHRESGVSGSSAISVSTGSSSNISLSASVAAGDASLYKSIPRSAQQQAVSHLLAVRRAAHRRRLRVYFAQLASYEQQYAQQLELIRTRRLLGMESSDAINSGTAPASSAAAAASSSAAAGHPLALPPAPVRPVFPLVPQNAEMDRLLIAASRSYFLSRLVGFRQDSSGSTLSAPFTAAHRDGPLEELGCDFTHTFVLRERAAAE